VAYLRAAAGMRFLVLLNLATTTGLLPPTAARLSGTVALATDAKREGDRLEPRTELAPDEGVIVRLD
jgi:hypothetical protein